MKLLKLTPFLFLGIFACQSPQDIDPNEPGTEEPASEKGTPTEVGKPIGTSFTQTIGPDGGAISTPDNKITFTFPTGAVSKQRLLPSNPLKTKLLVALVLLITSLLPTRN